MEHLKEQVNKVEKVNKLFHHLKGNIWSLEKTFDPIRCIGDKENSFWFFLPLLCVYALYTRYFPDYFEYAVSTHNVDG